MTGGGRPAMTATEIRAGLADQDKGRHWSYGRCWCEAWHDQQPAGVMVAPPWDAARGKGAGR